jgi:hypothetical protein
MAQSKRNDNPATLKVAGLLQSTHLESYFFLVESTLQFVFKNKGQKYVYFHSLKPRHFSSNGLLFGLWPHTTPSPQTNKQTNKQTNIVAFRMIVTNCSTNFVIVM